MTINIKILNFKNASKEEIVECKIREVARVISGHQLWKY